MITTIVFWIFLFFLFFIWATILESIAHFFIVGTFNLKTSKCSKTKKPLLFLRAICAISFIWASLTCFPNYPIYFLFVSALWITVHTDLHYMLISRMVSLYLAPVGVIASKADLLPTTTTESILASIFAAGFFIATNKVFKMIKGHDGMGQGDVELLACIGAWIGILGAWSTIVIASVTGTIVGISYILCAQKQVKILPFGPFLALGAMIYLTNQSGLVARLTLSS